MATELNLHRCITKMPHVKRECYERTRLYFVVYVCDHHCSLIYGKPPMTRDFRSLKNPGAFLQSRFCNSEDVKLINQVGLWSISSRVFDMFGADTEASIADERVAELDSLNRSFDLCRSAVFGSIIIDDYGPSDFYQQLFDLSIHCAKLSLFSHTFRGSSQRNSNSSTAIHGAGKFERSGFESALAVVRTVAGGDEIQKRLEMLPSYYGTMIAFAFISLIKAKGKEPAMGYLDQDKTSSVLYRLVEVFETSSARVQPGHPLCSVTKSLRIAMGEHCQPGTKLSSVESLPDVTDNDMLSFDNITNNSLGLDLLGDYDNLLSHSSDFHTGFFDLQDL
jgi:hypothetical protein